ncbi:MAG: hypothetical protein C0403_14430 [Desulfobacterium sp.]|nr:hypothetical protein [Desulfobacterium sp.]
MKILEKMILVGFIFLAGIAVGWVIKGKHLNIIFSAYLQAFASLYLDKNDISIKFENLSFLLGMDDVNLLGELSIAEEKYKTALDAINIRSTIHFQEVQAKLELQGIKEGGDYSMDHLEKSLGNRLFTILQRSTQEVIEHVEEAIAYLESTGNKLNEVLKNSYPQEKIISIIMPQKKEQP